MAFGVYGSKIAVIPLFDPDVSKSGMIIIPEMAKDRCDQGIVKHVGPDCKYVTVGDFVMFSGYTGTTLQTDDEGVLIILHEEFVVAKIEGSYVETTEVPGLFFKGDDGVMFPSTVEFALHMIALALQEAPWRRGLKTKDMIQNRPKDNALTR